VNPCYGDMKRHVSTLACCQDKHASRKSAAWTVSQPDSQTARPNRWPSRAPALGTDVMTGTAVPSQNVAQCLGATTPALQVSISIGWE